MNDPIVRSGTSTAGWAAAGSPAAALRRRKLKDRLATLVVNAGGLTIIISVLGILVFIGLEVLPLFIAPRASAAPDVKAGGASGLPAGESPVYFSVEEYEEIGVLATSKGELRFVHIDGSQPPQAAPIEALQGKRITSATKPLMDRSCAFGTEDGRVVPVEVAFHIRFDEDHHAAGSPRRIIEWKIAEGEPIVLDPAGRSIESVAWQRGPDGTRAAGVTSDGRLVFASVVEKKSMMGGVKKTLHQHDLTPHLPSPPVRALIDRNREHLFVGTRDGKLAWFDLTVDGEPAFEGIVPATSGPDVPLTALGFLLGDVSLVTGDGSGRVAVWLLIREPRNPERRTLVAIHDSFKPHEAPVTAICGSQRDKGFVTSDAKGVTMLRHGTSEQTLLTLPGAASPVAWATIAPRAGGVYALHGNGTVSRWSVDNPHPEITFKALFQPVHYEGYDRPELVWQSTGGTDDFEAKFSLTPLIFGTLKGTVYALIIAVPLAILGAIYTAQFMHPAMRGIVKPTIEVMAALPSVVLGFIAGLWMAPTMERILPGIMLMAIVLPISALAALGIWKILPGGFRIAYKDRLEIGFILGGLLLAGWLCLQLNGPIERMLFGGDFRQWWFGTTGLKFDQRNALVVGFAMGFAVIPIIFTISEDAISNVPRHLSSGSLALGATPWQTAIRVVLPTASPGIFSAIMIGFGRVVGETMIVLMATGNTPIMEWNLFNGFRTLSANIAVEIPEAPHGGTLYRTLFLGALLLFLVTFAVNTLAEVVRQRMRRRYQQI